MDTYWREAFRTRMADIGMTYSTLAKELKMSLPGVKKVFQKEDIGLQRFNQICRILEIDPAELIKESSRSGLKVKSLSATADAYLIKEPTAFRLYYLLTVEKLELDEATYALRISKAETYRILRQLDSYGLIQWKEGDQIALPDRVPFLFKRNSASAMRFAREQADKIIEESFQKNPAKDTHLSFRHLAIPKENLSEVCSRLDDLTNELYRKYAYRGRKQIAVNNLVSTRVLLCHVPGEISL